MLKKDIVSNSDTTYTDTDGIIYINGSREVVDYNYVWYSGKLWRITVLNPDGTIKLVTADTITTMFWPNNTLYADTDINAWLNTEFLNTLYNYQNLLKTDAVWDATIMTSYEEKPTKTTLVTATVGLLTGYEYYISYKDFVEHDTNLSILSNGTYQWSMTMTSTSSAYCTTAMSFGLNIESL